MSYSSQPTIALRCDMGVDLLTPSYLDTLLEDNFELMSESMRLERLCERATALKKAADDDVIVLGITAHRRTHDSKIDDAPSRLSPMQCEWRMVGFAHIQHVLQVMRTFLLIPAWPPPLDRSLLNMRFFSRIHALPFTMEGDHLMDNPRLRRLFTCTTRYSPTSTNFFQKHAQK